MKWTEMGHRLVGECSGYYVTIVQQRIDGRYLVIIEVFENYRFMVYEGFVMDGLEGAKEETLRRLEYNGKA